MAATTTPQAGNILYLTNTAAFKETPEGDLTVPTTLTGRYIIEEFLPFDPAAHQHEDGVIVSRLLNDTEDESVVFYISADVFAEAWEKSSAVSPRLTLDECGCYLDGQRGHYIARDTIDLASYWGFPLTKDEARFTARYALDGDKPDYPHEALSDLCDRAVDWLNENIAPEGASFGFDDGLYLLTADAWEGL